MIAVLAVHALIPLAMIRDDEDYWLTKIVASVVVACDIPAWFMIIGPLL